jgi:cyclopropane fatty-acyl-phospholipid synthase-like methyltransferase
MVAPNLIVPVVLQYVKPKSVVDFGCGIGTWLNAFKRNGAQEILGLDGDWYNKELLFNHIKPDEFQCVDLEQPILLPKEYDLVVSLEVAEHLAEEKADVFVKSLTDAGKIILFSAAFPKQGGLNHLNEQWYTYWVQKFEKHNYRFYDIIRSKIWNNADIQHWWYKQNMFFVVHKDVDFGCQEDSFNFRDFNFLHPDVYTKSLNEINKIKEGKEGVRCYIRLLCLAMKRKFRANTR